MAVVRFAVRSSLKDLTLTLEDDNFIHLPRRQTQLLLAELSSGSGSQLRLNMGYRLSFGRM
jgi:hypothetical protein